MESTGVHWSSMTVQQRSYRTLLESTGVHWSSMTVQQRTYRSPLDSSGFQWSPVESYRTRWGTAKYCTLLPIYPLPGNLVQSMVSPKPNGREWSKPIHICKVRQRFLSWKPQLLASLSFFRIFLMSQFFQ